MKKFLCAILASAIIFSCGVVVNGALFEKEKYSIELPDSFDEVEESSFIGDNSETVDVNIEESDDETICVPRMSEKDALEYAEELASEIKKGFELLGREGLSEVLSAEIYTHPNGKEVLAVTYKNSAKSDSGETVLFQRMYVFSGEKNQYSFTFTAKTQEELAELESAANTIKINEAEAKSVWGSISSYLVALLLFGVIVLGIIRFLRTPKKRK